MKNSLIYTLLAALMLTVFASCEKNDYSSYPPTWKGFDVPSRVAPGAKFKAIALQKDKGHLINGTHYNWQLIVELDPAGRDTVSVTQKTNYDGISNADPVAEFTMPANAKSGSRATLKFSASYSYSGNGIKVTDGQHVGEESNATGYIHSTSTSIFGSAEGSVRIWVE